MRDGGSTAILTVNTAYPVLVILLTLLALLTQSDTVAYTHDRCLLNGFELRTKKFE